MTFTNKMAVTVFSFPPPNLTSSARILYIVCYLKTFVSYYMFYTLHVVEPLRYDSVLIKETNE